MNTPIRVGGLFRCCLDRVEYPKTPHKGELLDCPHGCGERMIYWNDAWEWFRPDHPARKEAKA